MHQRAYDRVQRETTARPARRGLRVVSSAGESTPDDDAPPSSGPRRNGRGDRWPSARIRIELGPGDVEHAMLTRLCRATGMSAEQLVRAVIQATHAARYDQD